MTVGKTFRVLGVATRKVVAKPRDSFLGARMALWVVLVSILARVTSLPRAQRIASVRVRRSSAGRFHEPAQLARTIDALLRLDAWVFRPICWKRALVLHRFLALNGVDSRINFGVQKDAGGPVRGHAWLEREGRPFLEEDAGGYVVTFSLPHEPSAGHPAVESPWP